MLPESLQKILDTADYIEYDIDILKLDFSADPFIMDFKISDTEGSNETTKISMKAFNSVDFYIDKDGYSSYIHLEDDTPLLWRFTDTQCELYISGGLPKQVELTVFELFKIHNSFFGQYIPFDLQSMKVLYNGHGLLQKGSKNLLTKFADILNKNGIKTSIISETVPDYKNDKLKALFLGHSYVIAENFDFTVIT